MLKTATRVSSVLEVNKARRVVISAVLIASSIVLSRFLAICTPILTINFAFLPLMLSGMLMGRRGGLFVAVVSDLIGALLFPSGAFFMGYTLTSALKGWLAGALLYSPDGVKANWQFVARLLICTLIWVVLLNGVLNTVWVMLTTAGAGTAIVPIRILKQAIMGPIQFLTMLALVKGFQAPLNRILDK